MAFSNQGTIILYPFFSPKYIQIHACNSSYCNISLYGSRRIRNFPIVNNEYHWTQKRTGKMVKVSSIVNVLFTDFYKEMQNVTKKIILQKFGNSVIINHLEERKIITSKCIYELKTTKILSSINTSSWIISARSILM